MTAKKLEETVGKEFGLTPKFGVLRLLSEQLYSDRAQPIIEYVRNAWDADATTVKITVKKDSIVIEDNGCGMDLDGLEKFLFVGESPAPKSGKTKEGRKYMGKWGVGNLAAVAIGEGYKVTTTKKGTGERISYDLNFKELEEIERGGTNFFAVKKKAAVKAADASTHGTTIEIYGLNRTYTTRVNDLLELLVKEIGKKMPVRGKGFKVMLNGDEVPHYIEQYLKGARNYELKFKVTDDNGKTHDVKGWFRLAAKALSPQDSGIYPIVNEEKTIKDGHMYCADSIPGFFSLKNRIYGEFEADFLAELLTTSRDRFKDENHPLVKQIYENVRCALSDLVKEVEEDKRRSLDERTQEIFDRVTLNVSYVLSNIKIFPPNWPVVDTDEKGRTEGKKNRTYIRPGEGHGGKGGNGEGKHQPETVNPPSEKTGKKTFDFAGHRFVITQYAGKPEEEHIQINEKGEEILVNVNHPMYERTKKQGSESLETYMTCNVLRRVIDYVVATGGQALRGDSVTDKLSSSNSLYNRYLCALGKIPTT